MTAEPYVPSIPLGEWNGGLVGDSIECVRAENPGHMTLDGTNTWILAAPDSGTAAIVDPGPADESHWAKVESRLNDRGLAPDQVNAIVITHHHADHTAGIDLFFEHTGAPVYAATSEYCRAGGELDMIGSAEPIELDLGGLAAQVIPAPGHTTDSIALLIPNERVMLSGDTILGRGTTVVAYPDGNLAQYLDSLAHLRAAVVENGVEKILPGHGPAIEQPLTAIDFYLAHRQERLVQVSDCLVELGVTPDCNEDLAEQVVRTVYADVPEYLWPPATLSVLAQLEYLAANL